MTTYHPKIPPSLALLLVCENDSGVRTQYQIEQLSTFSNGLLLRRFEIHIVDAAVSLFFTLCEMVKVFN